MQSLVALILSISLVSCSSGTFSSGTGTSSEKGEKNQSSPPNSSKDNSNAEGDKPIIVDPKENKSVANPDPNNPYSLPPDTAVIPIAVGGASLTCMEVPASNVYCAGSGEASKSFSPVHAWYATDVEKVWVVTTFTKNSFGLYLVSVPESVKSAKVKVGIMLLDSDYNYLADLDINASVSENLVADPSFEKNRLNASSMESRYVTASNAWTAYLPSSDKPSASCSPLLHLDSDVFDSSLKAVDGSQWAQLSSKCAQGTSNLFMNIGIKQTIKIKSGRKYGFSFWYKRAPKMESVPTLRVEIGSISTNIPVTNTDWQFKRSSFFPAVESTTLMFEQTTSLADEGLLIDHISLIDETDLVEVLD